MESANVTAAMSFSTTKSVLCQPCTLSLWHWLNKIKTFCLEPVGIVSLWNVLCALSRHLLRTIDMESANVTVATTLTTLNISLPCQPFAFLSVGGRYFLNVLLWAPGCVEENSGIPQNRLNRVPHNPSWRPMLSMSCFVKENAKRVALSKFWFNPAVQQKMSIEREQIVMYADTQPRLDKTSPTESVDSASIAFFAIHNLFHH